MVKLLQRGLFVVWNKIDYGIVVFYYDYIFRYFFDVVKEFFEIKVVIFYGWLLSEVLYVLVFVYLVGNICFSSYVLGVIIYIYLFVKDYFFVLLIYVLFLVSVVFVFYICCLFFFKFKMKGLYFDLEVIWDEYMWFEFEDCSVEEIMKMMVDEFYVNYVFILMGGIG